MFLTLSFFNVYSKVVIINLDCIDSFGKVKIPENNSFTARRFLAKGDEMSSSDYSSSVDYSVLT